ncbi:glycoside hydrolase superfamily [Aspergillus egyptiacus]|nr:glycoside hydrolase superfamily [Aspergillus egyptiacus]
MPAPVAGTVCGPQVPGTKRLWAQCGTTAEFCTESKSASGAPGTAAPGTSGCISNCRILIERSDPPAEYLKLGYFEAYNLGRKCLHMDASQINTADFSHIHYGFLTLTPDFKVKIGNNLEVFEFHEFKALTAIKRIMSIGGWTFSTSPDTYTIFRDAVKPENMETFAQNVVSFLHEQDVDGLDIDWEYPGLIGQIVINPKAPDLPSFDPGDPVEGDSYTVFLARMRQLLGMFPSSLYDG